MRKNVYALIHILVLASLPLLGHGSEIANPSATPPPFALQGQLPPAPEGFAWRDYRGAIFAKPVEWRERTAVQAMTKNGIPMTVYAASGEEFSENKFFEMGLTIQAIVGSYKLAKVEASKMARIYLKPFLDEHKPPDALIVDRKRRGDFEMLVFRYRDAARGQKPIIVHKFIVANDKMDSAHIFTFESPEETWSENWEKFGTPILKNVTVVPANE
jgi:hypothetical protein